MDYKEQIESLHNLEAIAYGYNINGEVLGMDCSDFEQIMVDAAHSIEDLLSRAEAAEARCAALDEARENANEACAKWEGMYHMALERAEKDIEGAKPKEVLEAIDSLVEFARERMSIADWLYYANTIGPWRGEKED